MKTLYMTKGLPASGKSTAALALVASQPGTKRVNKDDLRAMIDGGKWSKNNEQNILIVRDNIIVNFLNSGFHVIVDDTNLAPKHEATLKQMARDHSAKFQILDFTNISPEICIERDLKRPNSVGQKVIMDMWEKYLKPAPPVPPACDEVLEDIIVCDIDGTIAEMRGRGPYDWDKVSMDELRVFVNKMLYHAAEDALFDINSKVFFVSGRDSVCREATIKWLLDEAGWGSHEYKLFMRPEGDMRRDSIVKREIYENEIKGKYNVVAIFDDRPQVIRECWQALGFGDRIFNVGDGREF